MDINIIKPFIGLDVEVLCGTTGVWIDGHLMPIAKSVIVLTPFDETKEFYGPCSMEIGAVQAIRQVKRNTKQAPLQSDEIKNVGTRSALEQISVNAPGRFVISK